MVVVVVVICNAAKQPVRQRIQVQVVIRRQQEGVTSIDHVPHGSYTQSNGASARTKYHLWWVGCCEEGGTQATSRWIRKDTTDERPRGMIDYKTAGQRKRGRIKATTVQRDWRREIVCTGGNWQVAARPPVPSPLVPD